MKHFDPEGDFILQWNKAFLLCSVIALSLDPLFLYVPIVNGTQKCLDMDRNLAVVACVLRSVNDILYLVHIIIKFRTAYVTHYDHIHGKRDLKPEPQYVAKRYLRSDFIVDVFAALPLPQLAVFVITSNLEGPTAFSKENLLKFIIFSQYVLRVIQTSLIYQRVTKISGFLIEKAWAVVAFNLFLYVLASHIVGALWYLFAIESELRCWHITSKRQNYHSNYLYCGEGQVGDYGFLNTSCPLLERNEFKDSTNFDFGIFLDALQTRITETRDLCQKILYCSWWSLQSLSSLGHGLKASTFYGEILFAYLISVIGLLLLASLIGNMQKYLQSYSNPTLRIEEMKEKRREAEDHMSHMSLPEDLRQRVRRHKQYNWETTRGVELDSFVKDLPRDLATDIKHHLYSPLLKKVPMFGTIDEHLLDAICDRLKPVLYTKGSYLLREGDLVHEMMFITRGELLSITTTNASNLKAGDFCGEELLTWALDTKSELPFSTRTIKAVTDGQAFTLLAGDLLFFASQFRVFRSGRVQHIFRYHSHQCRAHAACFIQASWRRRTRHKIRKHRRISKENDKLQGMETLVPDHHLQMMHGIRRRSSKELE